MSPRTALMVGVLGILAAGMMAPGTPRSTQSPEEYARRQYQSGLAFLRDGNYGEALKDFQAVVDQYPASSVADQALLQIALYHLEVARNPDAAAGPADLILKKYPAGEAAPLAHVVTGRILAGRGSAADLAAALASFERVRRLFPGSGAVPAAMFHAAETLRANRRESEALPLYRQVVTDHAHSVHAPRALLGEGACLLRLGRPVEAMAQWQRVRQRHADLPEAQVAWEWNTIAYRLYIRAPAQAAYAFTGRTIPGAPAKLKDVLGLSFGARGALHVAQRNQAAAFDAAGAPLPSPVVGPVRAVAAAPDGRVWFVLRGGALTPAGDTVALGMPKPDGTLRVVEEIPAAVVTSAGDLLVADRQAKAIVRFSAAGRYAGVFAQPLNAVRLARGSSDDVAALDRDDRSVSVFDRHAALVRRFTARGQGYAFANPVDIAFDALDHLYVLDRGVRAVMVFGAGEAPLTALSVPPRAPGALRRAAALAVDSAGRLFVYDDDTERVLVFQ